MGQGRGQEKEVRERTCLQTMFQLNSFLLNYGLLLLGNKSYH